ncbi:cytochrome b-c1 complex subunit Rieske, mitochondrial-like [Lineus longissimus]|uniref:cytochrome b-c1 complex subunit Rieske, mitochondrial-like n=1 Tax=Lineus longissimus TaxID=88925 RepID=UPI00315DE5E1
MMSFVARGGALSPSFVAVSQVVPNSLRPLIPAVVDKAQSIVVQPPPEKGSTFSLLSSLPKSATTATTTLLGKSQVRFAHTDIQFPDFSDYRRKSVQNSKASSQSTADPRRLFTYLVVGGTGIGAAYGAKSTVFDFVSSMSASADVLALAKIEVKLADIPEGKHVTFKWRGKPLFVRHRTDEEIATEKAVNISELRHQESDDERVKKDEWLVLLGVCTHLGCVPIPHQGDFGGYYCPCHGSHYDCSGRIRKGPAPLNMDVPTYDFPEDDVLVVG